MKDAQAILEEKGFTISGCMWGDAAWKMHKDKIYSLGQGRDGDFMSAPSDTRAETCLWIYEGPFDESWNPKLGELPLTTRGEMPNFVTFIFPNLPQAFHAMFWMMEAQPWHNNRELDLDAEHDLALDAEFINSTVDLRRFM